MKWWHLEVSPDALSNQQKYLISVVAASSRLTNALLGGDYKESLCSRAGRAAQSGTWWCDKALVPFLDRLFMEPGHCAKATKNPKHHNNYEVVSWNTEEVEDAVV